MKSEKDFIEKYLDHCIEYPSPTVDILPHGTLWSYISTTFLNAWINYVEIKEAVLITRYLKHEDNVLASIEFAKREHVHVQDPFRDDVMILARSKETNDWWFFWFDRDCSDSSIGRFKTDDDEESVRGSFRAYADNTSVELSTAYGENDDPVPGIALNAGAFRGWITL